MTNRGSTSAFQTEIVKSQNQPIHLVKIYFDSPTGTQYLTDSFIPITYDSNTYSPLGYFLSFSDIEETTQFIINSLTLSISGVDQVYINHVLSERFIDRKVVIYKGFLSTSDDSLIADPVLIFQGNMNTPSIHEAENEGMSTVSISVANQFVDFEKTSGRYTNQASQQSVYPGDLGFNYASEIIKDIVWGAEFDPGTRVTGAGSLAGEFGSVIDTRDVGSEEIYDLDLVGHNVTINDDDTATVYDIDHNVVVDDVIVITNATGTYMDDLNGTHVVVSIGSNSWDIPFISSPVIVPYEGGAEIQVNDESISPGITTVDTSNKANTIIIPSKEGAIKNKIHPGVTVTIEDAESVGGIPADNINGSHAVVEVNDTNYVIEIVEDVETTAPPISTDTSVTDAVTVNETDHGLSTGDSVVIAGSTDVGGVPANEINDTHTVGDVIDINAFEIAVTTQPTSTVTYGGGDSITFDAVDPTPPPIFTTSSSATVTVYQTGHGLVVDDTFSIAGTMDVGGIPQNVLNDNHTVVSVPDTNSVTFTASETATETTTGGGKQVIIKLPVKATSATTGGGPNIKTQLPVKNKKPFSASRTA